MRSQDNRWEPIATLFTVISQSWLISGQTRDVHFDAFYNDPVLLFISGKAWEAHFGAIYCDSAPVAHLVGGFTVISVLWPISGQTSGAHFDAICGDPTFVTDLRTSLGGTFRRYLW